MVLHKGAVMRRILAGIVLALMMTGGAAAAEPVEILSSGSQPCGDFVAAPWGEQQLFSAWSLGYISGQNSMDAGAMRYTGRGWTVDSVILWLKNYCSQHPLALFVDAAEKLRQELAAQEGLLPK